MASARVKLVGYLDVPADRWDEILIALETHIEMTRAEPGCIEFNVSPCSDVQHRLLVAEFFNDQSSFDAHQKRASSSDWAVVSAGLDRHYEISKVPV